MLRALLRMSMVISKAKEIKQDEERRRRSKRYGITAIILAIFTIPFAFLAVMCLQWLQGEGALLFIFIIPLMCVSLAGVVLFILYALFYWIVQLSINRRAITWIALVLMLVCFAVAALLSLQVLGATSIF